MQQSGHIVGQSPNCDRLGIKLRSANATGIEANHAKLAGERSDLLGPDPSSGSETGN